MLLRVTGRPWMCQNFDNSDRGCKPKMPKTWLLKSGCPRQSGSCPRREPSPPGRVSSPPARGEARCPRGRAERRGSRARRGVAPSREARPDLVLDEPEPRQEAQRPAVLGVSVRAVCDRFRRLEIVLRGLK